MRGTLVKRRANERGDGSAKLISRLFPHLDRYQRRKPITGTAIKTQESHLLFVAVMKYPFQLLGTAASNARATLPLFPRAVRLCDVVFLP